MCGPADSAGAEGLVDAFLAGQQAMYADGEEAAVDELLADDVTWHVPGRSPIAGDFSGRAAVLRYLRFRRSLAGETMGTTERGQAHHGDGVMRLADRHARVADGDVFWRTADVYRVANGKIAEAWSVPLDHQYVEDAWAAARPRPFVYAQRVRPQDCAASTMLGHPRFLEFFEAAFIECWRDRFGRIDASLGDERSLTVGAVNVNYIGGVCCDDEIQISVSLDRITKRSITVHYEAVVDARTVAEATSRYVCLDRTGNPAPLPDAITAHRR